MALSRLFDLQQRNVAVPQETISVRIDCDQLAYIDDLAEELELTRSDVLRECLRDGLQRTYGEWQAALENGKKQAAEVSARTGGKPGRASK